VICRAESPAVEQFARDHADRLRVIGLGTQDDLAAAKDFVARGGITFTMLWDHSFQSWIALGVRSQPAAVLYDADGTVLASWVGPFDQEEVLRLIDR
jgi:peroxiredoxin